MNELEELIESGMYSTIAGFKIECLRCKSTVCTVELENAPQTESVIVYFTCTMCSAQTIIGG